MVIIYSKKLLKIDDIVRLGIEKNIGEALN